MGLSISIAMRVIVTRHQKARKKRKGLMLEQFIMPTGYNRAYGAYLLTKQGEKWHAGKKSMIVGILVNQWTVSTTLSLIKAAPLKHEPFKKNRILFD